MGGGVGESGGRWGKAEWVGGGIEQISGHAGLGRMVESGSGPGLVSLTWAAQSCTGDFAGTALSACVRCPPHKGEV